MHRHFKFNLKTIKLMFKHFQISKRVAIEFYWNLHNKLGGWNWSFVPFPMVSAKRIGDAYDVDVCLFKGETNIHFLWLFLDVVLVVEDEWE